MNKMTKRDKITREETNFGQQRQTERQIKCKETKRMKIKQKTR